jgi:large subunit ribosomal protein L36e
VIKLSILLMYVRLFMPLRPTKTFYVTRAIIWFNSMFYFAVLWITIFECVPRRKIWRPEVPGRCIITSPVILISAVINVLSDFSILFLPIGCIWRLQLDVKRKVAVSAVFGVGLM